MLVPVQPALPDRYASARSGIPERPRLGRVAPVQSLVLQLYPTVDMLGGYIASPCLDP